MISRIIWRTGVVAAAATLASSLLLSTPANAVWGGEAASEPAQFGMARLGHTFTPVASGPLDAMASGTGGSTYTSAPVVAGGAVYLDLTNDSTVRTALSGTVSGTLDATVADLPNITVLGCDVAWDTELAQCPTGAATLAGPYPMNTAPVFTWGALGPAAILHVAVTTELAMANVTLVATVTDRAVRAGIDRTTG